MAAINNAGKGDIESQDLSNVSRKDSETYQSTILPASAVDFDPEPHKRLFRQFANPAPLGLCGLLSPPLSSVCQCPRSKRYYSQYRHRYW